jgi:hypothetical protein
MSNPTIASKLPAQYHKFLLLFNPKTAEKLPDHKGCNHQIELLGAEDKLPMGPVDELLQKEEKLLVKYLDMMIKEGKIWPSCSTVGSPILFVSTSNGCGLHLFVECRHLNDYTKKDRTPLPIIEKLSAPVWGATHKRKVDLKSEFHLIEIALGHEKYTAFGTKFRLYEYMVMPFGLCNGPATFQREIKRILEPLLGLELVIKTDVHPEKDEGLVVVAYINYILIATKGSLQKHHRQVSRVVQLLMDNHRCINRDKCVFDVFKATCLECVVSGAGLRMDPDKTKSIAVWPRPTSRKEVQ